MGVIFPLYILFWSLLIGATSAGMTVAVRALPFVQRRIEALQKPWACDICMSFWSVGLLSVGLAVWQGPELLVSCGPAYPWALWVLRRVTEPREPVLPALEDSDADRST